MHRRPSERTFLFGIHPVLEALNEGKPLQRVLFLKGKQTDEMSEILRQCREMEVPAQAVPKERLDRVTMKNHQGVVAFTSPIEFQPLDEVVLAAFEQGQTPLMVALDGVTDVRNLVSILSRFLKKVPTPSTALNPPPQPALCLETNIQAFPLR